MKKAAIFLATGFEEIEAVGTIDVLRRGGVDVTLVTIDDQAIVTGAHNIEILSDSFFTEEDFSGFDVLILPGGQPGSNNLNAFKPLKDVLQEQHAQGKLLAAICAAPIVLGDLGLLNGLRATCYPGFEKKLTGATIEDEPFIVDGNIITGKGPGMVFPFALAILEYLEGKAVADDVESALLP
jgi:4-methyl-5(b-hydroxyethyl)-thiazole monophosphate biosynthesis